MKTNLSRKLFSNLALMGVVLAVLVFSVYLHAEGNSTGGALISQPLRIGGISGYANERDADIYPKIAYEASTGRYLVVWMTPRNAGSSSDGFDVYGVFLNRLGQRMGNEFRISDDNTVARSSFPAVVGGNNEFVVAWTSKGTACRIIVQKITDTYNKTDRVLISGNGHRHSPSLVYNPIRREYALAYVEGDDYLPPTLFGAETANCGNNSNSSSNIKAIEFYFNGDTQVIGNSLTLSGANGGSFRPNIVYSPSMNQYLISWEDRRNAAGQLYRFDVYAQRISGQFSLVENNLALATGGDYTNFDSTATWTPRPVIADGISQFLTVWFARKTQDEAVVWSALANFVPSSGIPNTTPFTIARITFAQSHTGNSPAGYLSVAYSWASKEYLVGMSSYMESVWGYLSFSQIQRLKYDGQLLKLDGSIQNQPGVGYSVDYENEDQLAPGMAVIPVSNPNTTDFMIVYSKHLTNKPAQDTDIWSVRVQEEALYVKNIFLPVITKK